MIFFQIPYKTKVVWKNVALFTALHFGALLGLYQLLTFQPKWQSYVWSKGV